MTSSAPSNSVSARKVTRWWILVRHRRRRCLWRRQRTRRVVDDAVRQRNETAYIFLSFTKTRPPRQFFGRQRVWQRQIRRRQIRRRPRDERDCSSFSLCFAKIHLPVGFWADATGVTPEPAAPDPEQQNWHRWADTASVVKFTDHENTVLDMLQYTAANEKTALDMQ